MMLRLFKRPAFLVLLAALSILSGSTALADPFEEGNSAYFDGRLDDATLKYNSVVDSTDNPPPSVWLNLGNIAFQKDELGTARYFFEKTTGSGGGKELLERASHNLALTQSTLAEKYAPQIEKGTLSYDESHSPTYALFTLFSGSALAWILVLLTLLVFLALGGWTFLLPGRLNTLGKTAFLSLLLPFVLVAILYAGRVWVDENYQFGVVVASQGQFLEAPDDNAPGSPLPEGLRIRLLNHNEGGYFKVQRSDGTVGYVKDDQFWALDDRHTLK